MCTVISDRKVIVCDVSFDVVRELLIERLGAAARAETVNGKGTVFTCVQDHHVAEFQVSVKEALN